VVYFSGNPESNIFSISTRTAARVVCLDRQRFLTDLLAQMALFFFVELLGECHQLHISLFNAERTAVMRLDHLLKSVEEIVATRVQADQVVQLALDQGPQWLRFDVLVRRLLELPHQ
jgi:hypothetical protein